MSGMQPMNAARALAGSPATQFAVENASKALQASKTAQAEANAISNRCSGLLSLSLQQKAAVSSTSSDELQAILSNTGGIVPCSFFGVSPPIRNGWAGGAANPLAHDKTWDKCAYNASHVNLQALREIESNGASFLRGDILMPGSTPPDARMIFDQKAAFAPTAIQTPSVPVSVPMHVDAPFASYAPRLPPENANNRTNNEMGETKPFSCQTHYFLN